MFGSDDKVAFESGEKSVAFFFVVKKSEVQTTGVGEGLAIDFFTAADVDFGGIFFFGDSEGFLK